MTPQELNEVLEKYTFTLQPPFEPIIFKFEDGKIFKNGKLFCKYSIGESSNGHYRIMYSNLVSVDINEKTITHTMIFGFDNIVVTVQNDNRFPVILNFDEDKLNGSFTVLKAI